MLSGGRSEVSCAVSYRTRIADLRAAVDYAPRGAINANPMTSVTLMAIVGMIYAGTVIALLVEGQQWKALMFAGYAIAQVGIILDTLPPR